MAGMSVDQIEQEISSLSQDDALQLMFGCMHELNHVGASRLQCQILDRLLTKYKQEIVNQSSETAWQKNRAHVLFLMDTQFGECSKLLERLLPADDESLLDADPAVLSNLCVSYILTGRNRDAEELLKEIEDEEGTAEVVPPPPPPPPPPVKGPTPSTAASHLISVNLAIGTLYCVKNNYEFGLARIFKSLEPLGQRLSSRAWHQAKRCILSALDKHCKQMIHLSDNLFDQIISFLIECETCGLSLVADESRLVDGTNSIAYEARYLRSVILTIVHD